MNRRIRFLTYGGVRGQEPNGSLRLDEEDRFGAAAAGRTPDEFVKIAVF